MKLITIVNEDMSAPDFAGRDTDGSPVQLSSYWRERTTIVVFLRHLGCTFCRSHIQQLRKGYELFQEAGAEIVCVAMGDPKAGKIFRIMFDLPFPMLMTGDDTSAYETYNLSKGTLGQLFGPAMWVKGFVAMLSLGPKVIGRIQGDGFQMPGTFIIDRAGIVRLAYRSKNAADNPPNQLLLDRLNQLRGGNRLELEPDSILPASAG